LTNSEDRLCAKIDKKSEKKDKKKYRHTVAQKTVPMFCPFGKISLD
jgi:hypothetical protein